MRKLFLLSFLAYCCMPLSIFSQEPCGTFEESEWLDKYFANKAQYAGAEADSQWLYVPVTMQIVGNDDGGGYFSKVQTFAALCNLNEQYEPLNVKFYLHPDDPFIYHDNSAWYEHGLSDGSDLINENYIFDRINAFVVADPAGTCGYSWQDVIVMGKNCSGAKNSTWAHEVGHHFSLPHTFRGWEDKSWDWSTPAPTHIGNRQTEKADGSNCNSAGDRFCDTEPDFISNRWSCNSNGRSYQMLDSNGDTIRADGTLFMSYANDACQNRFSGEQSTAIRENIKDEHAVYLITNSEGAGITQAVPLVGPLDSAAIEKNGATLSWNTVPNAQYYQVQISLFEDMRAAILVNRVVEGTSFEITSNLPLNRVLFWRVIPYGQWSFCPDIGVDHTIEPFMLVNTVATNELEKKAVSSIAPNPVMSGQNLRLNINASEAFDAQLVVFDVNGRQVKNKTVRVYEGENAVNIETVGLVSGTYRAVLQNEEGSIQQVFAVIR